MTCEVKVSQKDKRSSAQTAYTTLQLSSWYSFQHPLSSILSVQHVLSFVPNISFQKLLSHSLPHSVWIILRYVVWLHRKWSHILQISCLSEPNNRQQMDVAQGSGVRGRWRWRLADGMVGWQGAVQGLSRRQIWTGTFKHGWDVKSLKTERQKHNQLRTLTDFDMWTRTDDKEYWPPSKQWGLLVCSLLARRTGGAGSLRCGSDLCTLQEEPRRTAARASAAEPHAMSTVPAGKTASQRRKNVVYCVEQYGHHHQQPLLTIFPFHL